MTAPRLSTPRELVDRLGDMRGTPVTADLLCAVVELVQKETIAEAMHAASYFTMRTDASIYPGVPFGDMNEQARHVAHTTAQQIAEYIGELI